MRGTPLRVQKRFRAIGIIPAHAGNTSIVSRWYGYCRDHPRACGEHDTTNTPKVVYPGSSPRMRGTLLPHRFTVHAIGIIPAHAGNTAVYFCVVWYCGDHPRACGEHVFFPLAFLFCLGSSPRMRGTLARHDTPHFPIRDHPRACGEHTMSDRNSQPSLGSSPRMRGTHTFVQINKVTEGIIPAHAGNTITASWHSSPTWDHPRACGEHSAFAFCSALLAGSSPRMRGTPYRTSMRLR